MDSSVQKQQMVLSDNFNANVTQVIPYSDKAFETAAIEDLSRPIMYVVLSFSGELI